MGLRVYKGDWASRDYENEFFREFSSNLVELFKVKKLNGILVGHPKVPKNGYLKPDCVLITPNRLVIIDFKNHGGKIWLPDENSFEDSPWRHDDTIVEGGTSINPFEQLKKQRDWVEDLIGKDTYGRFGIACVVCFQKDMTIMNKVPGKYQSWFSVTNSSQYTQRIQDILGVIGAGKDKVDIDEIFSYFDAEPYTDFVPISLAAIRSASEANERSAEAQKREYAAKKRVRELEKQLGEMQTEHQTTAKIRVELEKAKAAAVLAKQEADKAKDEFDEKKHSLDLATQAAIKAKAEAKKAEAEKEKAKTEAETEVRRAKLMADAEAKKAKLAAEAYAERAKIVAESETKRADALREKARLEAKTAEKKNKVTLVVIAIITVIAAVALGSLFILSDSNSKREEKQKAEEAAQLEEDYKNGRKCIPVERAADFVGHNVCVDYYVGYVNSNSYFIYLDNEKNGSFQIIIPKKSKLINVSDAKKNYLNKHIEVRGLIEEYNGAYEIKVTDLGQIKISE